MQVFAYFDKDRSGQIELEEVRAHRLPAVSGRRDQALTCAAHHQFKRMLPVFGIEMESVAGARRVALPALPDPHGRRTAAMPRR